MRGGIGPKSALCLLLPLVLTTGCTRHFFRTRADIEAEQVLKEKDVIPTWKIEQYRVYPDPRTGRFADPTNPDRPPMPPDDPAARMLAPNPQKPPHKGGVARVEGTGYLDLLEAWDAQNRSSIQAAVATESEVGIRTQIEQKPADRVEMPPPRADVSFRKPYLLKLDQAVELGIINSREFQNRREDLYLVALPVTLERFGFAAQFFATEQAIFEKTGRERAEGRGERLRFTGDAGFAKLFSTGALLLFQYANRTVVNLSGTNPGTVTSLSTLNLDLVQPLLRGGGKAVTLEPLTQVERNLLYAIRDFARFRKEYFQFITGGGDVRGVLIGPGGFGVGLSPGSVSLGTGIGVSLQIRPGNAVRIDLATGQVAQSEGYMPTVLKFAQVEIQKRNLTRLEGAVKFLQAYEGGGRATSLQVGQAQQDTLRAQSELIGVERDARDQLDRLKLQLGLPLDVPLELDLSLIQPILRQFERYDQIFNEANALFAQLDESDDINRADEVRAALLRILTETPFVQGTKQFRVEFPERWQTWQRTVLDDKSLGNRVSGLREERLKLLEEKDDLESKEKEFPADKAERLRRIELDLPVGDLELYLRRLEAQPWKAQATERGRREEYAARFRDVRNAFSDVLGEASNERMALLRPMWPKLPEVLVGGQDLVAGDLDTALLTATQAALEQRLDLMNERANLVDAWRAIAVTANSLQGVLNVGYHVDSTTPPNEARPLAFAGSRTRHQLLLNLELPLVRLGERNAYRASLIAYQRARRSLMAAEDLIANQVRVDVRNLQLLARNFRIQQQAVALAFSQVESAFETFKAPAQPGQGGDNATQAAALTQQLLAAYNRLPGEQRNLITTWVTYQIARQQLFLDLEMMPLDFRGVWIDEYDSQEPQAQGVRLLFGDH